MALIVNFTSATDPGNNVVTALNLIRQGISRLEQIDGQRAEAIGAGAATMSTIFGVASTSEAQALSDRIAALLAAYGDSGNAEFAKLRDLINAHNK